MPRKPETNPEVLATRRSKKRSNHARYMKQWRQLGKQAGRDMADLLESAAVNQRMKAFDPNSHQGIRQRSAAAALALSLSRHNITMDRSLRVLDEALASTKVRIVDGKEVSLPDTPNKLRANEQVFRLLERSGDLPSEKRPSLANIRVNILVMGDIDADEMKTIEVENLDE